MAREVSQGQVIHQRLMLPLEMWPCLQLRHGDEFDNEVGTTTQMVMNSTMKLVQQHKW
jgi:hypothetical protein